MDIRPIGIASVQSEDETLLEIESSYEDGLHGVEPGDRLQILYWMHKLAAKERRILKVHPQGDKGRPLKGVFRVRSPVRPNPIGVSIVTVKRIDGNRLFVSGLDALDGSPIIDIKSAR